MFYDVESEFNNFHYFKPIITILDLEYADDTLLFAAAHEQMQLLLQLIEQITCIM